MISIYKHKSNRSTRRRGSTAVEVALTLPIFIMFLAALMEFGHVLFVSHMLKAAAKSGARYGSTDGITTAQVQAQVQQMVDKAIKPGAATVLIRDAGVFDTPNMNPSTINYNTLPNVELSNIDQGHLYIVQVTVPYNQVALMPPFWVKNATVTGQSVLRHE
ncbi:MAG: TadE-like protein [Schlesneria sp.]|nr:TadE-like protein [Schlesneria sp.]